MYKSKIFLLSIIMCMSLLSGCGSASPVLAAKNDNTANDSVSSEDISNAFVNGINNSNSKIYVHISGAVTTPGVVELNQGDRLYEAVNKVGGFQDNASTDYCNLAEVLEDGKQYYIPTIEEASLLALKGDNSGVISHYNEAGQLNINVATKDELMSLSGIGQARAESIIEYRESNGLFSGVEDLKKVSGIKDNLYSKIESQICIE